MTASALRCSLMAGAVALIAGCSGEPPAWLSAYGWLAVRCRAAGDVLTDGAAISGLREQWTQVASAFASTTDQNFELRARADASLGWVNKRETARRLFHEQCTADALTQVRQGL
jgi:hypothetical protein